MDKAHASDGCEQNHFTCPCPYTFSLSRPNAGTTHAYGHGAPRYALQRASFLTM